MFSSTSLNYFLHFFCIRGDMDYSELYFRVFEKGSWGFRNYTDSL